MAARSCSTPLVPRCVSNPHIALKFLVSFTIVREFEEKLQRETTLARDLEQGIRAVRDEIAALHADAGSYGVATHIFRTFNLHDPILLTR